MKAADKKTVIATFQNLKLQGGTRPELAELLKKDPTKPNAKEQTEILDEVFKEDLSQQGSQGSSQQSGADQTNTGTTGSGSSSPQPSGKKKHVAANASIMADLEKIDYQDLSGDNFKAYVSLVGDRSYTVIDKGQEKPVPGRLLENQEFDFILVKAKPIMETRYVGVEGSPVDYKGLEILSPIEKPIHTSRMAVKQVLEMNAQILNQHSRAGHGKYYLLKK